MAWLSYEAIRLPQTHHLYLVSTDHLTLAGVRKDINVKINLSAGFLPNKYWECFGM